MLDSIGLPIPPCGLPLSDGWHVHASQYPACRAPSITRRLLDRFVEQTPGDPAKPPPHLDPLTERELEVLKLIARGWSNAELAEKLFLSETTVKTHVSSVLRKLGLRDRVQAVVMAYEAGLVRPGTTV